MMVEQIEEADISKRWEGSCEDCFAWVFHDDVTGHCGLYSCGCATKIFNEGKPTRFIHRLSVKVITK